MTKSFNCASCSAPIGFEGTPAQKCRYCGSTVIAPPELFYASSVGDFSSLTGKALAIAEIDRLIHQGQMTQAIKLFRETFGVSLAQANDAVERMERGESVDISGMRVRSSRRATTDDIESVKKIGYTIGGSILVTIVISLIIIAGVTVGIIYFTWAAVDNKIAVASNSGTPFRSTTSSPSPAATATPDMIEVLKIGGEGNGAGRFKDNRHVAVDGQGRIYSSDYSPHRIQVFDAGGKFINQWAPETGMNLYGLAADREGNVYIANNKGIFKHHGETGKLLAKATHTYPRGIALTWDNKLVVVGNNAIVIFDNSLKVLSEYKDAAESADSTFGFEAVTTDGSGNIFVLDRHKKEIYKFSAQGKFLDRFSIQANAAHALAVDPTGRLFVSDTSEIFVLDANGETVRSLEAYQAFGIALNQEGELFVAARPYVLKHRLNF